MYTVRLEIPELAERASYGRETTPVDAVEEFVSLVSGSPNIWSYLVTDDDGKTYIVDMAGGPSVRLDNE